MKIALATIALVTTAAVGMTPVLVANAVDETPAQSRATWADQPCEYEDSTNCFWDAQVEGNGQGNSFYVREIDGKACVMYVDKSFAAKNDHCWDESE